MAYFTDKAFTSSFLGRSKGLSEMLVKKDEDDDTPINFNFAAATPSADHK